MSVWGYLKDSKKCQNVSRFLLAPTKWGFANTQFSAHVEAELRHRYILSWGKHWLFVPLLLWRQKKQNGVLSGGFCRDPKHNKTEVKNPEQWNSPSQHEQQSPQPFQQFFLWGIFGLEKQMRDINPRVGGTRLITSTLGTLLQRNSWLFLSPWWEGGRKKDPSGNVRRNVAVSPLTSLAEVGPRACKISAMATAAPRCSTGFQKALWAPSEEQSLQNWSIFFLRWLFSSHCFHQIHKDQIKPLITVRVYMLAHT